MDKLSRPSAVPSKRFILCMILPVAILLSVSSCNPKKQTAKETGVTSNAPIHKDSLRMDSSITIKPDYDRFGTRQLPLPPAGLTGKAIELVADPNVYPDTVSNVSIVLHNADAGNHTTGLEYRLDKYEGGTWKPLNFPDMYIFLSIGLMVDEGGSLEFLTPLHRRENNYTPGRYRVTKKALFKFDTTFTVDSTYRIRTLSSTNTGRAFRMTVPEAQGLPGQPIDTLRVMITNNSKNQELINTDDFWLCWHNGDNQYCLWGKQYSGFQKETYPLPPGKSMEFAIPVKSNKYRQGMNVDHTFGPGTYTLTKWSKVDLSAEFTLVHVPD